MLWGALTQTYIKEPNMRVLPPEIYTQKQVRALMDACRNNPVGIRNRALIAVLYRTGLRINEALSLLPTDIRAGEPHWSLLVQYGKGGKGRLVGLDGGTMTLIREWLSQRTKLGLTDSQELFCTTKGGKCTSSSIRHTLPKLAKRAGLNLRVHAHGFRHSCAVDMLQDGAKLTLIQKTLGHSHVGTTDRYLNHVRPQDVIEFLADRSWDASRYSGASH